MTHFEHTATVAAPPEVAFDVVADVEQYPSFLKDVKSARRQGQMVEMTVLAGPLELDFTNRARFDRPRAIYLDLVKGPFKSMHAVWTFEPLPGGGTRVRYTADFELALRVPGAAAVVARALSSNAERTVAAFKRHIEAGQAPTPQPPV